MALNHRCSLHSQEMTGTQGATLSLSLDPDASRPVLTQMQPHQSVLMDQLRTITDKSIPGI